jgi:CRP-like cAMP-binding protein
MGVAFARGRPAEQRGLSAPSRHLDLFAELEPAECRAFLARCTRQQFRAGANLFSQGEPYTRSYLIQSGVVRTYYVAPSGKEITIAYWPEGTLVGGPNVFKERRPHIWSAQAATDVFTQQIKGRDLEELSMRIPRLAHYLIESLSFKLSWVSVLLQTFGTQSVRGRVAYLLLQLGDRYGEQRGDGTLIAHHFSHEEIARMVGATRSWVTLSLKELKNQGIIATRGREILILSRPGLQATAQDRKNRRAKR